MAHAQVPAHAQHNHVCLVMTPFERALSIHEPTSSGSFASSRAYQFTCWFTTPSFLQHNRKDRAMATTKRQKIAVGGKVDGSSSAVLLGPPASVAWHATTSACQKRWQDCTFWPLLSYCCITFSIWSFIVSEVRTDSSIRWPGLSFTGFCVGLHPGLPAGW